MMELTDIEKDALERLEKRPLILDSSESGADFIDALTALTLWRAGLIRIENRLFNKFVWLL